VGNGRWLAEHLPDARLVELPGEDHNPWYQDADITIGEIQKFLTGARGSVEAERTLATVLFTDVVDSTRTAAELGDERWRQLLERHHRIVREAIVGFGGREVKSIGDGFMATFDGPARAIRCAQAIVESSADAGLRVRAGVHTGECEVMGDDIGGIAVHIAARVSALAEPSEVLVSRTVKDLVAGSGIDFADRGTHALKGVPDSWQLYAAL
jgi:class 3 adenylate cyclase